MFENFLLTMLGVFALLMLFLACVFFFAFKMKKEITLKKLENELELEKAVSSKTPQKKSNFFHKNRQKGKAYEFQIGKMYKEQGYKIYYKGINEGKKDGGIDLIAYKDDEALLIQCKNWEKSQIKQEHLRIFLGDCTALLEKQKNKFKNKKISRLFITSCPNLEYATQKYIEQNNITYLNVAFNNAQPQ